MPYGGDGIQQVVSKVGRQPGIGAVPPRGGGPVQHQRNRCQHERRRGQLPERRRRAASEHRASTSSPIPAQTPHTMKLTTKK